MKGGGRKRKEKRAKGLDLERDGRWSLSSSLSMQKKRWSLIFNFTTVESPTDTHPRREEALSTPPSLSPSHHHQLLRKMHGFYSKRKRGKPVKKLGKWSRFICTSCSNVSLGRGEEEEEGTFLFSLLGTLKAFDTPSWGLHLWITTTKKASMAAPL